MNTKRFLIAFSTLLLAVLLPLSLWVSRARWAAAAGSVPAPGELPTATPRAAVDESRFDFGIMDPLSEGSHAFTVRNTGAGPLRLTPGSTTCKCTLSRISRGEIPPGESGQVVVIWNTGRDAVYQHGANIHTNDPSQPLLQLQVTGTVRVQLGVDPPALTLTGVEPHRVSTASLLVYSQLDRPFEIEHISCSLAAVGATVGEAASVQLERRQARCGQQVSLEVPAGMDHGLHQGVLQIAARFADRPRPEMLEVPVSVEVLRPLAVYGPGVDMTGTVDLGSVAAGCGLRRRLVLKVRDELPALRVREIVTDPTWLKAEVAEYRTRSAASGLYYLDIEVPPDAPVCSYRGPRTGRIQLTFDHPRIADLSLQARLSVTRSDR